MKIIVQNELQLPSAMEKARQFAKAHLLAGRRMQIEVQESKRSLEQNARLWAMLGDVSKQVNWHGRYLSPESWKHIFSASLKKQDVVPGLDGGFVILGQSTSKMTIREMGDLMTLIEAFGAQQGVRFTAPEVVEA